MPTEIIELTKLATPKREQTTCMPQRRPSTIALVEPTNVVLYAPSSDTAQARVPVEPTSDGHQRTAPVAGPSDGHQRTAPVAGPSDGHQRTAPVAGPSDGHQRTGPVAGPSDGHQRTARVAGPSDGHQRTAPVAGPSDAHQRTAPVAGRKSDAHLRTEQPANDAQQRRPVFGEFLVEQRVLDRYQLFRVLQLQDRMPGTRLGHCAVALGYAPRSEIEQLHVRFVQSDEVHVEDIDLESMTTDAFERDPEIDIQYRAVPR